MEQKITMKGKDGLVTVLVEGGPQLPREEKERIQKEWEKPENQEKLEQLVKMYGEYKKVIDPKTGIAYKVPTRDIITKGLKSENLNEYPTWEN